jgi:dynactin complex subunit
MSSSRRKEYIVQTIEQAKKLYQDAINEARAANEKVAKCKTILEEMRSEEEAALGIDKKPTVYRGPEAVPYDASIGGDGTRPTWSRSSNMPYDE